MKELYDFLIQIVMVYPLIFLDAIIIALVIIRGYSAGKQSKKILRCVDCLLRQNGSSLENHQEKEKP
jgi:hypothetical protein